MSRACLCYHLLARECISDDASSLHVSSSMYFLACPHACVDFVAAACSSNVNNKRTKSYNHASFYSIIATQISLPARRRGFMPTRIASNPHKTNIHVYRCNQRLCSYFMKLNRCEVAPIVATHHNQNVRGTNNEQKCVFITLAMQSNEDVHEESLPREDIHGRANAIDPATPAKRDGSARRQSPNSRMLSRSPSWTRMGSNPEFCEGRRNGCAHWQ